MTRKTHKGIVGKTMITGKNKPDIGQGISFTEMNLTNGDDIEKAARQADKRPEK